MAKSEGKSILYYGCVGCGVVVFLAVAIAGGLAGFAWVQVKDEQVEDREVTAEFVPWSGPTAADEPPAEVTVPPRPPAGAAPSRVTLDLSGAGFKVRPAAPGEPFRVAATYDTNGYSLEHSEQDGDDGSKEVTVRFRQKGNALIAMLRSVFGGTEPDVTVFLPTDGPLALDATVSRGALEARLDGLWLTEVDLDSSMGATIVEVGEPSPYPVERMSIRARMGGNVIRGLGYLSPRDLDIRSSMGGAAIDFDGPWQADASIRVDNQRGGMALMIPHDLVATGLEGLKGGSGGPIAPPEGAELPGPTLRFEVTGDVEDVEVQRQ